MQKIEWTSVSRLDSRRYICGYCDADGHPDMPYSIWCKKLEICINDWGTCKHYSEKSPIEGQEE